jgi:protein-disulfide isomerase
VVDPDQEAVPVTSFACVPGELVLDPLVVAVKTVAGRATHVADDHGRTLCGDAYGPIVLRTEDDPTCAWCRAAWEELQGA